MTHTVFHTLTYLIYCPNESQNKLHVAEVNCKLCYNSAMITWIKEIHFANILK